MGPLHPSRRRGRRGAVLVEYAFLLVAFAIPVMAGITAGGVQMYNNYKTARDHMLGAFP